MLLCTGHIHIDPDFGSQISSCITDRQARAARACSSGRCALRAMSAYDHAALLHVEDAGGGGEFDPRPDLRCAGAGRVRGKGRASLLTRLVHGERHLDFFWEGVLQ